MWRTILSAVIALVVAWFAIKIIFWVLGFILHTIGWLVILALGAAISIPIYLFVRQKLLA